ncbi:MAG: SRPBCC family protein [Niabella sp.]|nr:SRPBCC family protein [Niabella sp.]
MEPAKITVAATINAPVAKVWEYWTEPEHIKKWNSASDDWHTPRAENDLRTGGAFSSRMEARDGSMGFDFGGIYDVVLINKEIAYTMGDGRKVQIFFAGEDNSTTVTETFDAETTNPIEMQQAGWQAIMDNFKRYTEEHR